VDAKQIKELRLQLSSELEKLTRSLGRSRLAEDEIKVEKTEDEGDLAMMSHQKDILYSLHERESSRLRFVQQAITAIDRGQYGECARCGEEIGEKRMRAVPWATMCISCQEEIEAERISSRLPGLPADEPEP